jgi:hypothetical protein
MIWNISVKPLKKMLLAATVLGALGTPALAAERNGCYGKLDPEFVRQSVLRTIEEVKSKPVDNVSDPSRDDYNFFRNNFAIKLSNTLRAKFWDQPGFLTHYSEDDAAKCFPEIGAMLEARKNKVLYAGNLQADHVHKVGLEVIEDLKRASAPSKLEPEVVALFVHGIFEKLKVELVSKGDGASDSRTDSRTKQYLLENQLKRDLPSFLAEGVSGTNIFVTRQMVSQAADSFPELKPLVAEQQAAIAVERARRQQLADEQRRLEIEAQKRAEIEARKPENRLIKAYQLYSNVQFCNQLRQGYMVVWVNDLELERARAATKAIEKSILVEQPGLNTNNLWQTALANAKGWQAYQRSCDQAYSNLLSMSPVNVYPLQKP